ncbi:hypothetical protein [Sorangium sp. So ce861]|uniref:hypothetical protein n=1 Tax=Sorangium sp. So ce861 TaxID=3133323 RepID=UPI003F61983E
MVARPGTDRRSAADPAHQVTVTAAAGFFGERLGFDPGDGVTLADRRPGRIRR